MSNLDIMKKYVNPHILFDWLVGTDGEYYLFFFGRFVCSCDNLFELQEEQEKILHGNWAA